MQLIAPTRHQLYRGPMQPPGTNSLDDMIAMHIEMVQGTAEWEAGIELTAARGTYEEKLERIETLRGMAGTLQNGLDLLSRHSDESIYATEKPEVAASVLALRDHLARMRTIAADGAELLEEHL